MSDDRPLTIPAVREWLPAGGTRRPATPDDVVVEVGAFDPELGAEGYELTIGERIVLRANEHAGAHHGTRTLEQLAAAGSLPNGTARDWPRYPERGLMVDIGRQAFDAAWLAARIEEMSRLKLNLLHLHLSENEGWRIESEQHPEIVSAPFLTKTEVRDLVALAARHHITVVPEIDMPGHMGAALAAHPELRLRDREGRAHPHNLDFTLPEARRFARQLVEEYLDLFPGPYWHAGADEFLLAMPPTAPVDYTPYPQLEAYARSRFGSEATVKDGIIGFVNDIAALVRDAGRTLRVWNDGLAGGRVVALAEDVIVEVWSDLDAPGPAELLANGHRIVNCGYYPTYFIQGYPAGLLEHWPEGMGLPPKPRAKDLYERWAPHRFHGPIFLQGRELTTPQEIDPDHPGNLGAKVHIWCDDPTASTPDEIATGVQPYLYGLAQQTWGSEPVVPTYAELERVAASTVAQ